MRIAMEMFLIQHETGLRLTIFIVGLLLLALLERKWPRRNRDAYWPRWATNVGLIAVSTTISRLAVPLATSTFALLCMQYHFGLLNQIDFPVWAEVLIAIAIFDAALYVQHRMMHHFHWLWRLHRVHHTDIVFDVSLGIRFHPAEILLSIIYKFAIIAIIGIAPVAVVIYESMLLGFSLWTHANLALPARIDTLLRWLIVTPEMHRVHHSVRRYETDSNYGNILSLWDRCFGSYNSHSKESQALMPIGLDYFRHKKEQNLISLLVQPFRNPKTF